MKKNILFVGVVFIVMLSACIKDRTIPASGPITIPTTDTLIYYWNFNKGDSSVRTPDFSKIGAGAYFSYNCAYIDYTNGSKLNLLGITDSGQCLRVRNPSTDLIFYMPTTGYDSVVFIYAEEASSTKSGSTINSISYTVDGQTFTTPTTMGTNPYNVDTTFTLQTFNFSSDPAVNNNPKFAVKISFVNNNTGTSGNDRFDNVSLSGSKQH